MKTLKTMTLAAVAVGSMAAFGGPPPASSRAPLADPSAVVDDAPQAGRRAHLAMVVAISEALELSEADALRMSERLRGVEERRQPVRAQMHEAMKAVRAAAGGDAAAQAQVDANIQKVLDGRAQMAALDKELFASLAKDLTPQKKAKLAMVLAHLGQMRGGPQRGPGARWQR